MARLPNLTREQLKPGDQQYFDQIVGSRGGIRGPFGVLLHSPDLAARVAATGAYVRYEGDLSNALREVIILATAREIKNQYEFTSHARLARQAGVPEDTIQAIARGTAPRGLGRDEALVTRYAQELVRDRRLTDLTFNALRDRFGVQATVDVTVLIGHYLLVGCVLAAFEVDLTPGMTPELPE
jgi:4-carboxymuconolactone decarboxylase